MPTTACPAQLAKVILSSRRFGHPLEVQVPSIEAAMPEPEPDAMTMQERRVVEFPYIGVARKAVMPLDTVMLVCVQEELAPVAAGPDWGVPVPIIVMPMWLGTVIPVVDQVQVPLGMLMTS